MHVLKCHNQQNRCLRSRLRGVNNTVIIIDILTSALSRLVFPYRVHCGTTLQRYLAIANAPDIVSPLKEKDTWYNTFYPCYALKFCFKHQLHGQNS